MTVRKVDRQDYCGGGLYSFLQAPARIAESLIENFKARGGQATPRKVDGTRGTHGAEKPRAKTPEVCESQGDMGSLQKVIYGPRDETATKGAMRTNYAVISEKSKTLFLNVDNGSRDLKGYQGFSKAEKAWMREMVERAKKDGLSVVATAHIPPNLSGRHSPKEDGFSDRHYKQDRAFIQSLREIHPDTLFVFGHIHESRMDPKDPDVDYDGMKDGKVDADSIILPAEKSGHFTKITQYEHGKAIIDMKAEGDGEDAWSKPTKQVFLDDQGREVKDASGLGKVTGVTYALADIQRLDMKNDAIDAIADFFYDIVKSDDVSSRFHAIASNAKREADKGHDVHYLIAGDIQDAGKNIPVRLPQHENVLWVPGNHDYTDTGLKEAIAFLQPPGGGVKFHVDYENGRNEK